MTGDNSIITVAVPTCNGTRHLREALAGILGSETAHDLVIVDDRSDDDSVSLARELIGDRGRVEVNSERLGLAKNWNRCVALSRTPLVAIFHQDDVMLPGHLARHVEKYHENPSIGWIASNAQVIDDSGHPVRGSVVEQVGMFGLEATHAPGEAVGAFATRNPLRCSGVTLNASAHAEVGGFDPCYRYVVDWDFWVRVAKVRPVAWLAEPSVAIRWHLGSETHRFGDGTLDLDETVRLLDGLVEIMGFPSPLHRSWRKQADSRLARAFLNRAYAAFKQGNPSLARKALGRSIRLNPRRVLGRLLVDPRLLAQMAATIVVPRWVEGSRRPAKPSREPN